MKAPKKVNLALALAMALAGLPVSAATFARSQPIPSPQDQQQPPDQTKDKKKDKKKKQDEPSPGSEDSPDNVAGARRAIKRVLSDLQDGFEGHSPRRVTGSLDERFEDLPRFEDAVTQFLERTSEMRINLRESTTEESRSRAAE